VRQIFPAAAEAPEIESIAPGASGAGPAASAAVTALARLYAYPPVAARATPWVRANMIASVDGAASLNGRSGGLSGDADRLVFSVLRSLADVILVGARTARAEKYRLAHQGQIWAALREGQPPTPPIAVVTRELDLDLDGPLLAGPADRARTILLTTRAAPAARRAAAAARADVILAGRDSVTPVAAVDALAARGHRKILVEGGPNLLGQITGAGLLDELCMTFSPVLEGGRAGRILAPPPPSPAPFMAAGPGRGPHPPPHSPFTGEVGLTLAHVLEDRGSLLCRYLRDQG
jgi:riboflavin biosynthesis pyrimidine reductase